MVERIRVTAGVGKVLAALLADPEADRYGLDLMRATGHPSGTLYPILVRLQRAGWVNARWEEIDAAAAGRPARRYYRLTPGGIEAAQAELAAIRQALAPARRRFPQTGGLTAPLQAAGAKTRRAFQG